MKDDNNLSFDDWEGIMNQQVLDVYSYVLRSMRALAIEQSTDIDLVDMYAYKQDKTIPENFGWSKRVLAEEDRFKLTDKGILFRKFQSQAGQKMCHQLVLPAKHR